MGLERTPNKSQHTMLNLEKSILQRERQTSLKRMLSASFGDNLITLDYAALF